MSTAKLGCESGPQIMLLQQAKGGCRKTLHLGLRRWEAGTHLSLGLWRIQVPFSNESRCLLR